MKAIVPTELVCPRLHLRGFIESDWQAMHEHYSDTECTKFTFRRSLTEGESWRAMASMGGHWQLRGYGPYAVVEKASGQVAGAVGLWFPNDFPEAEIKWLLTRRFWGRGFASEAVRTVQAMVAATIPEMRPISLIHIEKVASIKVARSVGASHEGEIAFRGEQWSIYRHPGGAKNAA